MMAGGLERDAVELSERALREGDGELTKFGAK
jgi:hypothetical protein